MKVLLSLALWTLSALAPSAVVAESPQAGSAADAPAPIMAVWVERKIHFQYSAVTAYYSCDGLQSKVSAILTAMGARPGFKVKPRGCFSPRRGAEWTPSLDIVAAVPRAATPEVLAELAKDASSSELAAKAGGKPPPAAEATAEFPARVRRVDFRDSPTGLVQPGDCELIDQMRDGVFVPLGATIVVDRMGCVTHTLSNGIIVLSIEVLQPVPPS